MAVGVVDTCVSLGRYTGHPSPDPWLLFAQALLPSPRGASLVGPPPSGEGNSEMFHMKQLNLNVRFMRGFCYL
jgi:hypothetical protein